MTDIPEFTSAQAERLRAFLAAPQRPEGTMSFYELAGFLYTVCSSPELLEPSEWMPMIFNEQDAGYVDLEEAQRIQPLITALYNHVNHGILEDAPVLPEGCELPDDPLTNFEDGSPFGAWAQGFAAGHDWLSDLWDAYVPDELDEDLGGCMMVLGFFSNQRLADAYHDEFGHRSSFEKMATDMQKLVPEAMSNYAHLGRSIAKAIQEEEVTMDG